VPGGFVPAGARLDRVLAHLRRVRARGVFAFDVYGRFNLVYARELRARAVALLAEQDRVGFERGLRKVGYGEAAVERVCLDDLPAAALSATPSGT
jgi:hypothetical protein